jgi:hypothetical protein
VDIQVKPQRHGFIGAFLPRLFTHTLYWSCPRNWSGTPPEHVSALRDAVNILDDPQVEARFMDRLRVGDFR